MRDLHPPDTDFIVIIPLRGIVKRFRLTDSVFKQTVFSTLSGAMGLDSTEERGISFFLSLKP